MKRILLAALIALAVSGCASTDDYDPINVDESTWWQRSDGSTIPMPGDGTNAEAVVTNE